MISASQINTYIACSMKYNYKYIKKISPALQNPTDLSNLFLGQFVHKGLNFYFLNFQRETSMVYYVALSESLPSVVFEKNLDKTVLENLYFDDEASALDYLKSIMDTNYYRQFFDDEIEELKTKTKITPSIYKTAKNILRETIARKDLFLAGLDNLETEKKYADDEFIAFFDLAGVDKDFNTVIFDFKITQREFEFKKKIQDMLYSYLIKKTTTQYPKFRYVNLKYRRDPFTLDINAKEIKYSQNDMSIIEDIITTFQRAVRDQIFFRNEGSFLCSRNFCEYYDYCQSYQNIFDEEESENEKDF